MSVFPIFPAINFRFPAGIAGQECRLAWRRSDVDGRSRGGFLWPLPGEWTPIVQADTRPVDCSHGLHAATSWAGALGGPLFQLIAIPVDKIAFEGSKKLRFAQAAVVAHLDIARYFREGCFVGADLQGANLCKMDLRGSNLHGSNLHGSNLHGCNLSYSNLRGSNLHGCNLSYCDLTGSNLHGCNLSYCDLTGAIGVER